MPPLARLADVKATELLHPATRAEIHLLEQLEPRRFPRHVAIIMDGNGRWAQRRHLPRIAGHRSGTASAKRAIETSAKLGIEVLTLYAFSVENWRRPKAETDFLMRLLREYLRKELPAILRNNIRLYVLGRLDDLPDAVRGDVKDAMERSSGNTGMKLAVALNYGGRAEIVDAVNSILAHGRNNGAANQPVDEELISKHLYTAGLPDPDLLIRTSGEMRVSNFLLWQIAYAELYVTETLWPDFDRVSLLEALLEFQKRERRYGGLGTPELRRESA